MEWKRRLNDCFFYLGTVCGEDMDKASIETKKDWLSTIKAARRLYEDTNYKEDEFDINETLSKWIALEFKRK